MSQLRHGLMVLGNDEKHIESVVSCLGGSTTLLQAQEDKDDFYNNKMAPEMKAAAGKECHWIIIKGDASTEWRSLLEPMNSVLDDNKVLCLESNEHIPLPPSCRIVVLAATADKMGPAIVSRLGVINM